jgi:hypothetical protein
MIYMSAAGHCSERSQPCMLQRHTLGLHDEEGTGRKRKLYLLCIIIIIIKLPN